MPFLQLWGIKEWGFIFLLLKAIFIIYIENIECGPKNTW